MSFLGTIACFSSVLNNIPSFGCINLSIHLLEDVSLLQGFVKYKYLGYKYPYWCKFSIPLCIDQVIDTSNDEIMFGFIPSGMVVPLCSSFSNEGKFLCSVSSPVYCVLTTLDWFILDNSLQYVTGSTVSPWFYVFISFSKASLDILSP